MVKTTDVSDDRRLAIAENGKDGKVTIQNTILRCYCLLIAFEILFLSR